MKHLIILLIILLSTNARAQEDKRGTIKVQKKGKIQSVMFDNVTNRLVGMDRYGNVLDSAVSSYKMMVTIQGIAYEEKVVGTTLSSNMQNRIKRVDGGTTVFFTEIKVKEKNGTFLDWPKFSSKLGYAFEKEEN